MRILIKVGQMLSLSGVLAIYGCGDDADGGDGPDELAVPASIVTDAQLLPGALAAYDADSVKEIVQSNNDDFMANTVMSMGEPDCSQKLFDAQTLSAKGGTFRISFEVDFSECIVALFKETEGFEGADFSDFVVTATFKGINWGRCEGVDLSELDGKPLGELSTAPLCDGSGTKRSSTSESISSISYKGKIADVTFGEEKVDYTYDFEDITYYAKKGTSGRTCSQTVTDGVASLDDKCVEISRNFKPADTVEIEGQEPIVGEINKSEYIKLEYSGLTENADVTSRWYTGGMMNVTVNDWAGTVKFSSATAEPIYELVKGTETVTGTIKEDEPES